MKNSWDTQALFERCLVPCALYAEFWLRYVSWARVNLGAEAALAIATRAATVFLPTRADVLAVLATLLEAAGRTDDARAVYAAVRAAAETPDQKAFGALLVANFERRRGEDDKADAAYADGLADGAEPSAVRAHVARYRAAVKRDLAGARACLDEALAASPGVAALWQAKAQVEASRLGTEKTGAVFARVAAVFDAALDGADANPVPHAERGALWAQYQACANDLCDDAGHLLRIAKGYARWRTEADLNAAPLGPVPKKRKRAPADAAPPAVVADAVVAAAAAPTAPPSAPPGAEKAASALLSSYGAYASYGAPADGGA